MKKIIEMSVLAVLLLTLTVMVSCKNKPKPQTLEERVKDLVIIKNEMNQKDNEYCIKWDAIASKLQMFRQAGRSWNEIQGEMMKPEALTGWKVSENERDYMAATLIPLLQRGDRGERALGSFTPNEIMGLAHAVCGEYLIPPKK